jgi:predicted transcriptional regulator
MNKNSSWSVLEESFDILGGYGYPATDKAADELGLEPGWFTWVAAIWLFGSEAFTTAKFMHMFPYGSALVNEERFSSAVRHGYLISDGKNGYLTTEDGSHVGRTMWRAAGDSIADLPTPPETDIHRLLSYLTRIADAALDAPEPPSHFYISHKRENYGRYGTKRPLEDFVVCFGALSSYRDDSHIAAWQMYSIEGNRWEVLSYIWRGEINTLDKLFEQLNYRGISRDEYAQILQELVDRGLIKENAGEYQLTAEGKRIREEAEALTDRYFFAPWSCLNDEELEDLQKLAKQLCDGFQSPNGVS